MDVMLICSVERPIKLHEVIAIHEEEGAEIVNANHSVARHKIFYSIHSRVITYDLQRHIQSNASSIC
jgi:hypothetical protein